MFISVAPPLVKGYFSVVPGSPGLSADRVVRPFLVFAYVVGVHTPACVAEPWRTTVEGWVVSTVGSSGRPLRQLVEHQSEYGHGTGLVEWIVSVSTLG
jgi:hypothetical protein